MMAAACSNHLSSVVANVLFVGIPAMLGRHVYSVHRVILCEKHMQCFECLSVETKDIAIAICRIRMLIRRILLAA